VKGYVNYFGKKMVWFLITLVVAFMLNFILPRLMPGDPVAVITARVVQGMASQSAIQHVYEEYAELFGTKKPMHEQFFLYVKNMLKGDFGTSFSQYPRPVSDIIRTSVGWTVGLQLPAIIVGWLIGNMLGALAAYMKGSYDKVLMPTSLFISSLPAFGIAVILLVIFGVTLRWLPTSGGYGFDMIPSLRGSFLWSVFIHYLMPFWSVVFIIIGGQAIGMRSMCIYELNADYVKFSRYLGIKDRRIVRYVFRNAMLPQITGLALAIGTIVGGALFAEIVFSYPGLGFTLLNGILSQDYPLISAAALIITLMVLITTLVIEILYGFIDPRVKAAQSEQ
jgi:peptide/nickel transport system permease protein